MSKSAVSIPLISLVVPCFNEQDNLKPFLTDCETALPKGYNYELIFVDDGSTDNTAKSVGRLKSTRQDMTVKLIELARNFGKEVAVTAGLHAARGNAALMIDCDLQHPPSDIPKFISKWQNGADIVIGIRKDSKSYAPMFKRIGSFIFYKIINAISATEVTPKATDFRLVDRAVIKEFNKFNEHDRITRGLIDWLGYDRQYVEFEPAERLHGVAAYSFRKLTGLALNSFIAMSFVPLKLAGYCGFAISLLSGLLGVVLLFEMFLLDDPLEWAVSASVDLAVLIVFLIGIVLMALGMIALYIATIHTEVTNRPLYVVKHRHLPRPRPCKPDKNA